MKKKKNKIKLFYFNRPNGYEVDHIIPLCGKNVSGLHTFNNLQYLTSEENRLKNNKLKLIMARYTYAFSNGDYNDWHRARKEKIAMIDIDSVECCQYCYEPLAIIETCYDKDQKYKATTLSKIIAERLNIPCFLVFYKQTTHGSLTFRIKRIRALRQSFS